MPQLKAKAVLFNVISHTWPKMTPSSSYLLQLKGIIFKNKAVI